MKRHLFISMLLAASLLAVLPATVSADQNVSPGDDIQAAVDFAAANGGTVHFAAGTYIINLFILNPAKSFTLLGAGEGVTFLDGSRTDTVIRIIETGDSVVTIEGFTITHGYTVASTHWGGGICSSNANLAVCDCTFEDNEASSFGGGMCNHGAATVTVTGCTFNKNVALNHGGGMYNNGTSPVVTGCTFEENSCNWYGGGMYNNGASTPTISHCTFLGNDATVGGGMYNNGANPVATDCTFLGNDAAIGGGMANYGTNPVATDCTFIENFAYRGGGMYNYDASPVVTGCTFEDNEAFNGGGMMNAGESAPEVTDCTFIENFSNYGGGMHNDDASTPTISHCTFLGNDARYGGGGMRNYINSSPTVTNCVFVGNTVIGEPYSNNGNADGQAEAMTSAGGGGMDNSYSATPVITNCTFTQNSVPYYSRGGLYDGANGGGVKFNTDCTSTVTNCIIWGNFCGDGPNDVLDTEGDYALITYSNVGGGYPGEGNIYADPLFVSAPTNVSLRLASPCIDAGTDTSAEEYGGVTDDILGVRRPQRSAYDMGAYEACGAHESIGNPWSPVIIQPLARTQLQSVLSLWEEIQGRLPDEPADGAAALIAQIQGHMANAAQLTNPIYASGQLTMAAEFMDKLDRALRLNCRIHSCGQSCNGTVMLLSVNETLYLDLPENPTTGYEWSLEAGDGLLVVGDSYMPNDSSGMIIGGGGVHTWAIKAKSPGIYTVSAAYVRPWDAGDVASTFEMTIKVG